MEGKTLLIDMQKNFFVGQYYFVFCRIPCCVGGLEEVFRAIVNRSRVYPPQAGLSAVILVRRLCGGVADWKACLRLFVEGVIVARRKI